MLLLQNKGTLFEARESLSSVGLISQSTVGLLCLVQPVEVVWLWKVHLITCSTVCLKQAEQSEVLECMMKATRGVRTVPPGKTKCAYLCSKLVFPLPNYTEYQEIKIMKE